jgi:hypothetical protein
MIPQSGRSRDGSRESKQRCEAEEHRRAQGGSLAVRADGTPVDVPVEALAQQHGQLPIPVFEQGVELSAIFAPGAGDEQDA